MSFGYFLLSCFHGMRECFVPVTPRKTTAWLSTVQTIIVSAAFGSSIFLVAFKIIPPLSITSLVVTIIGLCTSVLGVVASALDHPEIYLAYGILSGIITGFNLVTLCYFVYVAIRDSMNDVYLPQSERFWSNPDQFNVSIGACAIAFAAEMTLFLISAHFAIRARADALVRLENEEVDALLQDTLSISSRDVNRSFREQVEQQTRVLNDSQRASRNSLTQSQRDDDLPL